MKYVVQKGIAGLGNRLQGLGLALDIAHKHGARLAVDWTDAKIWRMGFDPYFRIDGADLCDIVEIPEDTTAWPECWRGNIGGEFCRATMTQTKHAPHRTAETIVVCRYNSKHSDRLFRGIRLSAETERYLRTVMATERLAPGNYDLWHIRHTDKRTDGWREWLGSAIEAQESTGIRSVVVTDSLQVQKVAHRLGLCCPSSICDPLPGGGVHHADINDQAKHVVNMSAIADMWLAIKSRQFTACCPTSTFSEFAERMRRVTGKGASHEDSHP